MEKLNTNRKINTTRSEVSEDRHVFNKKEKIFSSSKKEKPGYIKGGFVRGPIPLNWLSTAAGISNKSFKIGIALWYLNGLQGGGEIKLTKNIRKLFHISRYTVYRALDELQNAGLILTKRHRGRLTRVTLLKTQIIKRTDG